MDLFVLTILGRLRFAVETVEDDAEELMQLFSDLTNHHEVTQPIGFETYEDEPEDRR